jgi:hypothetical protein
VARANSLLAIVVLPLLLVVSHGSTVFIASTQQLVRYPWLPPWVALVATVGCLIAWVRVVGRRHDADRDPDYEAQVLTWLVGPVALFLVMAQLSGPMARFIGYDDAQLLAAPQLVFHHGLFPFRDIYLLHGILGDVLDGAIGMVVFGNTRWGVNSGLGVIVNPLTLLAVYAFAAYFCRKNRLVLVMVVALMSVGFFGVLEPRFVLLPVVLILFDRLLRRPTWGWSLALMFGLVAGSILSPEFVIIAACVLVVLVAFEGARWRRGEPLATTFARTIRCAAVGLVLCVGWALYLGLNHALSPFISFFSDFSTGHNLEGTFPAKWHFATDYRTDFEFFLPTVLWWLTVWRVVAKLRLRRTWLVQDWVMVAAALLALVYFPKALDRADAGHVFESYSVTVPLLALWVFEVLAVADRWLRSALGRARTLGAPTVTHLATALTTVAVLAATFTLPTPLVAAVLHAPARFHPSVPVRASGLLGYSVPGTTDVAAVAALGQLIDRYAGPTAPVFDFADEPGVLYYLLNRVPGTRFFFSNSTQTAGAQQQEISDLERSRPPVAVYNDTSFGIPNFDGVPDSIRSYAVSEYLFTHYRPLVDFEGQLLLLRDDLVRSAPPLPPLPQGSSASALYLAGPACTFGDIPNFFTPPADPAHLPRVTARTRSLGETSGTVGGWAVDPATGRPAAAVVATTASGRMVAFGPTGGSRADVAKDLADPAAATSGFTLVLPGSVRGPVTVYGLTPGGQAYRLDRTARVSPRRVGGGASVHTITVGGRVYRTASVVTAGDTDTAVSARSQAYLVTLPPTVTLSHYPWLRITSATPLGHSTFVLTNDLAAGAGAQITFDALPRSKHSLIMDTDSCLQWHGYSATAPLYLFRSGAPGAAQPLSVTLLGGPPPS